MVRWSDADYARFQRHGPAGLLPEKAWQQAVVRVAKQAGFLCYHTYDSRRSPSGFPDLVLCHPAPGHPLYTIELKTDTGSVSQAQQAWLDALGQCTEVVTGIWRPAMAEQVVTLLRS